MQRIRVLVVDDHRIFAESLAAALASEQDVEAASSCGGAAALRCLERGAPDGHRFDVLLVDAELGVAAAEGGQHGRAVPAQGKHTQPPAVQAPTAQVPAGPQQEGGPVNGHAPRPGGLALVARVRAESPRIRVVVLAERDDPRHAAVALQAGAGGWVAKDCSLSRLLHVIRGVLKGETHLPPALLTGVLRELTATRRNRTESEKLVESLTPREHEVLRCMVAGLGRKAVAERLYLSPHTVRTHMQNVLGKLGVHSTLAAVALARRAGVGPVDLEAGANTGSAPG